MTQEIITLNHPDRAKYLALIKGVRSKSPKSAPVDKGSPGPWEFCVKGQPVPKPTMTRTNKGMKRPIVRRYFAWCRSIKAIAPPDLPLSGTLKVKAYLAFPKSYSKRQRALLSGTHHLQKPDATNILKGVEDALFVRDQGIYKPECEKFWDDGRGARVEIFVSR